MGISINGFPLNFWVDADKKKQRTYKDWILLEKVEFGDLLSERKPVALQPSVIVLSSGFSAQRWFWRLERGVSQVFWKGDLGFSFDGAKRREQIWFAPGRGIYLESHNVPHWLRVREWNKWVSFKNNRLLLFPCSNMRTIGNGTEYKKREWNLIPKLYNSLS